ncbi:MAG: tellurite resistance TerB family protein [Rhodospirillaceae bacterium]|nr:tellurite resistance TerB family protein [Rhodospirillaceae bacterium]
MINVDKILGQILNAGQNLSQGQTLAGGLLVGGLAGAMTGKTGKKIASTALQLGGAAAVAGLAYTAYQRYRAGQGLPGAASPTTVAQRSDEVVDITPVRDTAFLPPPSDTAATEALSLKLIRAMVGAAKADGQIDNTETDKIFGQIDAFGLNHEERAFLLAEINKPLTAGQIAGSARNPEEAAEIYAVSVMAVNPHGLAERLYLGDLARLLKLEPALAKDIHDRIMVPA